MANLKKLEKRDITRVKIGKGEYAILTKQEIKLIIQEILKNEIDFYSEKALLNRKVDIEKSIMGKIVEIEKSIDAFIEYKFDKLAEKVCDMLISRKFDEEVQKKAKELIDKKDAKGRF